MERVQDKIDTLEKTIEYAKRIEKDYKTKFDEVIQTIKELTDDSEDNTMYEITLTCKELLLEILQGSDKE